MVDRNLELDFSKMMHLRNYNNPLLCINEGLIRTYPIEISMKFISEYYNLDKSDYAILKGENDVPCVKFSIPNVGKNGDLLKQTMKNLCGYFCSCEEINNGRLCMQFEPKFTEAANVTKYLFHVTPTYNIEKIKKIGITPKSKNDIFDYPSRIYFWEEGTDNFSILKLVSELVYANPNIKKYDGYSLITVNTDKLSDVKFYDDSNFTDGVFTYDNIPPDAIENINDINMNIILEKKN